MRGRAAHVRDKRSPPGAGNPSANPMMSYTFIPSLIYNAGEVASAWAVVACSLACCPHLTTRAAATKGRPSRHRPGAIGAAT